MRTEAYRVFEIAAWPAAVVAAAQVALLFATTSTAGLSEGLLLLSCSAGMIAASRLRRAAIAAAREHQPCRRAA